MEFHASKQRGRSNRGLLFVGILFLATCGILWRFWAIQDSGAPVKDTLVIYIFADSNDEAINNLRHFVNKGVRAHDGADYLFVVQGGIKGIKLPALPANARYLEHANECFDLGTIGWLVKESKLVDINAYKFIVWLNSSVRGPYLPAYFTSYVPWHRILTRHISHDLKLFGATISCSRTAHPKLGDRQHPHVQTYVAATDLPSFQLMLQKKVFDCHTSWQDAIFNGELAASKVVLDAGYNIGCLMLRYQDVDFRQAENQMCNGGHNPLQVDSYDGVSVNPLEVMFIKVKKVMVDMNWPHVALAVKYDQWGRRWGPRNHPLLGQDKRINVTSNEYDALVQHRLKSIITKGPQCFDLKFYRQGSPHEFGPLNNTGLWDHFIKHGFTEGRPHRFTC